MMIGSGGAVASARDAGAWVVTPATLGVGLLEFHQFDRMVQAGRVAARALLEQSDGALGVVSQEVSARGRQAGEHAHGEVGGEVVVEEADHVGHPLDVEREQPA